MSDSDKTAGKKGDGGKGGNRLVFVVLIGVIAVLAAVVVVLLLRKPEEPAEESDKRSVLVNEDNAEEILERNRQEAQEEPRAVSYIVTMKETTWTFEDGRSASPDSWVKNDPANDTDVYFDITRNDTGETIYESPIIPLGQELSGITLDADLEAGTYDCTMRYSLLDDDQETVLSTVDLALTIVVEN